MSQSLPACLSPEAPPPPTAAQYDVHLLIKKLLKCNILHVKMAPTLHESQKDHKQVITVSRDVTSLHYKIL